MARQRPPRSRWVVYSFALLCLLALGLLGKGLQIPLPPVSFLSAGVALSVVLAVVFVREAYAQAWTWTGFVSSSSSSADKSSPPQTAKTLWDWLQLFIVPAVLAAGGLWFAQQQQIQAGRASMQQYKNDLAIAQTQAQELLLSTYMDRISDLLLDIHHPLDLAPADEPSRAIARARTLQVLRELDASSKGRVIAFLDDAGLITSSAGTSPIISLNTAYLAEADMHDANLTGAALGEADLQRANLQRTILTRANLQGANLTGAKGISDVQVEQDTTKLRGTILPSGKVHS
jgi:hypothetical protein